MISIVRQRLFYRGREFAEAKGPKRENGAEDEPKLLSSRELGR